MIRAVRVTGRCITGFGVDVARKMPYSNTHTKADICVYIRQGPISLCRAGVGGG